MKGWHYAKSDEERHQRILASAARFREKNRERIRAEARQRYHEKPKYRTIATEKYAMNVANVVNKWGATTSRSGK